MTSYRIKQNQRGEFHSKTKSVVCPNAFCNELCLKSHTHLKTILVTQELDQSYALVIIRQNLPPCFFNSTTLVQTDRNHRWELLIFLSGFCEQKRQPLDCSKICFLLWRKVDLNIFFKKRNREFVNTPSGPYIICRFDHSGLYQITCMMSLLSSK